MSGLNKFPVAGGVITDATTRINDNNAVMLRQSGLNLIRQLEDRSVSFSADGGEWAEAYTTAAGRLSSVNTAETTAFFDTDKYEAIASSTEPFVIIEATSLTPSDFEINDCKCAEIGSGKWQLSCSTGTDEVKRAQIYKTLFYGTDSTDYRASSTYITNITALKTNIDRDVGKQGHLIALVCTRTQIATLRTVYADVTFNDTTNNTDCSSWSRCYSYGPYLDGTLPQSRFELPTGTILNSATVNRNYSVNNDFTGTDLTINEIDNPSTARLRMQWSEDAQDDTGAASVWAYLITSGTINVSFTGDTGTSGSVREEHIDFYTDNSIPVFTATTEDFLSMINHDIPSGTLPSNISICIGSPLVADWEDGADIQYKLTNATEDTGWLDSNKIESFTAFTSEPEQCIVKLIPKTTSPTVGYPAISGFGLIGDTI